MSESTIRPDAPLMTLINVFTVRPRTSRTSSSSGNAQPKT